jgi:hypothetical protein
VFTGFWSGEAESRDALIAPALHQNGAEMKAGAAPEIIQMWLKDFEKDYYFFLPANSDSLLFRFKGRPHTTVPSRG